MHVWQDIPNGCRGREKSSNTSGYICTISGLASVNTVMSLWLQSLGEVNENGVVYALSLRKIHCDVDETQDNRRLWTSRVEKSIQHGSAKALVEHLIPDDGNVDPSYRMCFLAVYRTFMSPSELLQCLLDRFAGYPFILFTQYCCLCLG